MKCPLYVAMLTFLGISFISVSSCNQAATSPSGNRIDSLQLKRGEIVVCGPPEKQFGAVSFVTSCPEKVKDDFDLGLALLHSFEYDEAEKVFAKVIDAAPDCAMAYWGVAMSNYHLLWTPPSKDELEKGAEAIGIARELAKTGTREAAFIEAASQLYTDWEKVDHISRCRNYEKAMEKLHQDYPKDKEAASLYALSLDASADPADTLYINQHKAGAILDALYPGEPNHPGIVHYIIHTYDNPEMARLALPAARRYADVAPSSAHALHMPSHIFTRLGLWDESIKTNLTSVASAKCYAEQTGIKGHWDEEFHSLDYLVYAYLQKGANAEAKQQWDYLNTISFVSPFNFKVAYSFAAIPSRYVLENRDWEMAASLQPSTANGDWKDYPWQSAIIHFTRLLGSVHTGKLEAARSEEALLKSLQEELIKQKDNYKAGQVKILATQGEAWILYKEGKSREALALMKTAADMEDNIQKHPVSPGEVLPARELLGDMLLLLDQPASALEAYESDLKKRPNRFNALYGAGLAAERSGNFTKASFYYQQLIQIASPSGAPRPEIEKAKSYLLKNKRV